MNAQEAIQRLWPEASAAEQIEHLARVRKVVKANGETRRAVIMQREEPITKAGRTPIAVTAEPKKDPRVVAQERREKKGKKKAKKAKIGAVAKIVNENGITDCDPSLFASAIAKRAEKIRRDGESSQQAYARCIMHDPKGVSLFRALKASSGQSRGADGFAYPAGADRRGAPNTPETEAAGVAGFKSREDAELDRLARKHQNKNPGMTYEAAYTAIYAAPENKQLRDAVRTAGLVRQMQGQGGIA